MGDSLLGDAKLTLEELAEGFLTRCPDYPPVRLRVEPGEGFRLPAGGVLVDGCTLDQNEPDSSITADTMTPRLVIAGSVNSVVEQLLAFREKVGPFGTLYYPCHDWVDPQLAKRSMALMVEQVMPKVNAALKE